MKTKTEANMFTHSKPRWLFILSVLLIYPLPQMAIDAYLPSWPAMVNEFHTTNQLLQLSLTMYVLFLGVAQLIYGPLSDRFGRRPVLFFGIALFFVSSLGCIFTHSIYQLLLCRAIQGLGIGCGFTVASSILADVFQGKQLAKIISYSAMVYSLSLIFSPAIGGYLQHYIGWQANFAMMAIYAIILFALIYFFVSETKDSKKIVTLSPSDIIKNYLLLFTSVKFIGVVMCLVLAYGIMITFNIVGPFLFQETLHISVLHYGQLLLLVGLSYFIGATLNSRIIKYTDIHVLIVSGLALMTFSSVGLLIASIIGSINVTSVMMFACLALFSLGLIYPNCFAYALDIFSEKGYASALIGSIILIGVSVISAIVSRYNVNHEFCLSITFLILAISSILSYLLTRLIRKTQ